MTSAPNCHTVLCQKIWLQHTGFPVISVHGLAKNYGDFQAVADLSFEVQPGEIVGLVGANGAGKTTSLRAITGILRPSAGQITVGGYDIQREAIEAKRTFAFIPDTVHPYELLTVTEHLHFVALTYRVQNAEAKYAALLAELELLAKAHEPASSLSRGMVKNCRWHAPSCVSRGSSFSTSL